MFKFLIRKQTWGRDVFVRRYASDAYILDVGCRTSRYNTAFSNKVNLDIRSGPQVDVVGDAHALPFDEATFDCIICAEVLEHLHTPTQAIDEMYRVLKPGGRIILTTRFMFPQHGATGDYFRFSIPALQHLFRAWDMEHIERESRPFGMLGILLQRIGYQTDLRGGKMMRGCIFFLAWFVSKLDFMVCREYSDLARQHAMKDGVFSTGYYIVARKSIKNKKESM